MNTTPLAPADAPMPTDGDLAMDRSLTQWRTHYPERSGVMAKQAWYASWHAAIQYAKEHPEILQ